MLEWINEDFFWVPNKTAIYNINKVDRFYVKENEYSELPYSFNSIKKYWITIDFSNYTRNNNLIETGSKKEALDKILNFLKNRPTSKKNDEEPSKILID